MTPLSPGLQSCVPFTPVTGARVLLRPSTVMPAVRRVLAQTLKAIAGAVPHHRFTNLHTFAGITEQTFPAQSITLRQWIDDRCFYKRSLVHFETFCADAVGI